jgi:pyrroloquinoline quinone biosynthesis protein B
MTLLDGLSVAEKKKIWFIHYNHTNPLMNDDSKESKEVRANGFNLSRQGQVFSMK